MPRRRCTRFYCARFTTDLTDHDPVQDEVTMKCSGLLTCHPLEPDTRALRVPGFVRRPQCADVCT